MNSDLVLGDGTLVLQLSGHSLTVNAASPSGDALLVDAGASLVLTGQGSVSVAGADGGLGLAGTSGSSDSATGTVLSAGTAIPADDPTEYFAQWADLSDSDLADTGTESIPIGILGILLIGTGIVLNLSRRRRTTIEG
ncbi:MAG: LPXTG cell wall anchor domain-containing protein [Cryobacterium sp.]|nr:LPXTG cell wall anchor domain-containing protein [Cryobacterium sp.]